MKKGVIIGAGIGGLTTAIALMKKGVDVVICEQAPKINEVGAGLWVAPNGLKVFDQLGISAEMITAGKELDKISVVDLKGKPISEINGNEIQLKHKFKTLAIHRAQLQKILVSKIPSDKIFLDKKFKSYQQNENSITATFEDGSSLEADFLICADGIKSKARQQFQSALDLRYSGQTCWRFVSEFDLPEKEDAEMFEIWSSQKGLRIGYSKINDKQVYVYITNFEPSGGADNSTTIKENLIKLTSDFPKIVKEMILSAKEENIIRNDLFDFKPIQKWTDQRFALIGDAAHATTPNLGQGACQAIEDAYVLANELSAKDSISDAFTSYEKKRIKKATYITQTSWTFARITNTSGILKKLIIGTLRLTPKSINDKQLDKIYSLDY
jgi:2-polyprenyl-6-methoxyphenol hydroxylase-like FAD-dependent oxidoreductase